MKPLTIFLVVLTLSLHAADRPPQNLREVEDALKVTPDDPMLHYQKCRLLFSEGKEQAAIDHATVALEKFKAAGDSLPWMGIGSISTDRYRISVHYNMSQRERAEKKHGIVRPYSFRVWTKGDESRLVQILDFELAYHDGKLLSAAVGETTPNGHANYGIVDPDSDFATIKKRVLEILEK